MFFDDDFQDAQPMLVLVWSDINYSIHDFSYLYKQLPLPHAYLRISKFIIIFMQHLVVNISVCGCPPPRHLQFLYEL